MTLDPRTGHQVLSPGSERDPVDSGVRLSWTNPTADFAGTVYPMSRPAILAHPAGGSPVCDRSAAPGSGDSFTYFGPQPGVTYYYSALAYDQAHHYSISSNVSSSASQAQSRDDRPPPDNTPVRLSGVVGSAVFPEDGVVYVAASQRTCGIRVVTSNTGLALGDRVDVSGSVSFRSMSGQRSERQIANATVNKISAGEPLRPVAMPCLSVGGGPTGLLVPGVVEGVGLNNVGALVKITGRVSCRVNNYLWIDDGSNIPGYTWTDGGHGPLPVRPGRVSREATASCVGVVEGSVPSCLADESQVHTRSLAERHPAARRSVISSRFIGMLRIHNPTSQ